jgi:hypothetical protein
MSRKKEVEKFLKPIEKPINKRQPPEPTRGERPANWGINTYKRYSKQRLEDNIKILNERNTPASIRRAKLMKTVLDEKNGVKV